MRDMVILVSLDGASCRSLARKLRAGQIYCKILPADVTADEIRAQEALGVLLCGGAKGEEASIPHLEEILACELPLMAMGDAALTLCTHLGGSLEEAGEESLLTTVSFENAPELFEDVEDGERYLPCFRAMHPTWAGAMPIARTESGAVGFRTADKPVFGLNLQMERNDLSGAQLLINFCKNVCGCTLWWSNQAFVERAKDEIARAAQGGEALCAISGGVDSGVCAMLGHMALGHRLHCIFVDTGLLREDESERVMAFYRDRMGLNVKRIDASEQFLSALEGLVLPAEKEEAIFRILRSILNEEAAKLPDIRLLIQGTNFTDSQMQSDFPLEKPHAQVLLVEPVRELFKDEIRRVGEELGMPPAMTQRQPFPGSGLGGRIMAEITPERLRILRRADAIFRAEIEESGQNKRLWQYFAALALGPYPGDGYVITLRAMQAVDGAASMPARLPSDLLERVSKLIRSGLPEVERVMYDLTPSRNYAQADWK